MKSGQASRKVLELLSDGQIRSLKELRELGVSPQTLRRLVENGEIENPGLGLYQVPRQDLDPRDCLAAIAKLVPVSMVWMLSAAAIHGITQDMPANLWLAVPKTHRGTIGPGAAFDGPPLNVTRLARENDFEIGVETVKIRGVDVRITKPERTVVDMWRYSTLNTSVQAQARKIDDETFLDALTNYLSPDRGGGDLASVAEMADKFGVLAGMEPHLKAVNFVAGMRP